MIYPEPESSTMEWKKTIPSHDQIIKTLIGFCNQNGGRIVIGVQNDGMICGISDSEIDKVMEYLDNIVYKATYPQILPRIYMQCFEDKQILIIEVSAGMNKPYFLKSEGQAKGTFIRLGRSTLRATTEIIEELQWQSRGIYFDAFPVYKATIDVIDEESIQYFLNSRKNQAKTKISTTILQSYHLIATEHGNLYPTTTSVLIFGKNPQYFFSEAMIICTHFAGVSGREVIATVDCNGSLFEQFKHAYSFVLQRLHRAFTIKGPQREEILEIPQEAVREAILNSIIHRNYHMLSPIKVSIYDDRIEIFSPGQFVGPFSIANLKSGITYMRNPAISKIFRESGYVEKMGTGLITIFDSYEQRGLATPQLNEGENFVKCILPRGSIVHKASPDLNQILELFKTSKEITLKNIMITLSISRATAGRRINELIKQKKIYRVGQTRNVIYRQN
ncbi:MAG: RNA-binding domain-containing protein [Parachlamydiaceae bacterium]